MDIIAWLKRVFPTKTAPLQPSDQIKKLSSILRKHKERMGRVDAARELGELKDPRAIDPLVFALRDADRDVRFAAARALASIGDQSATAHLIELFRSMVYPQADRNGHLHWNLDVNHASGIAMSLAQLGDVRALSPLLSYLRASNHMMKNNHEYGGGLYGDMGAHFSRVQALEALVQFARSCRDIPRPEWKKVGIHIEEWCFMGENSKKEINADIELPVCADDTSDVAGNQVMLELAFPIFQHVQQSNIHTITIRGGDDYMINCPE
jgi:hypothetical protein